MSTRTINIVEEQTVDLIVMASPTGTRLLIKQPCHEAPFPIVTLDFKAAILLSEQIKGAAFFIEAKLNEKPKPEEKAPVAE